MDNLYILIFSRSTSAYHRWYYSNNFGFCFTTVYSMYILQYVHVIHNGYIFEYVESLHHVIVLV